MMAELHNKLMKITLHAINFSGETSASSIVFILMHFYNNLIIGFQINNIYNSGFLVTTTGTVLIIIKNFISR